MIGRQHLLAIYKWLGPDCPSKRICKAFIDNESLYTGQILFMSPMVSRSFTDIGARLHWPIKGFKAPIVVHTGHSSEVIYTRSSSARPISSTIVSTSFLDAIASPAPTIYAD